MHVGSVTTHDILCSRRGAQTSPGQRFLCTGLWWEGVPAALPVPPLPWLCTAIAHSTSYSHGNPQIPSHFLGVLATSFSLELLLTSQHRKTDSISCLLSSPPDFFQICLLLTCFPPTDFPQSGRRQGYGRAHPAAPTLARRGCRGQCTPGRAQLKLLLPRGGTKPFFFGLF